jgi:hypothetical protein
MQPHGKEFCVLNEIYNLRISIAFKIECGNFVKEMQQSTSRHYEDAASKMF